jgi:hypothetical protein
MRSEQQSHLEALLRLAADQPAQRPAFCAALLAAEVYILGSSNEEKVGMLPVNVGSGNSLSIQHWQQQDGRMLIPFFTSLAVLQEAVEEEQQYLVLSVRSLFEMTQGSILFLNPSSDYGKEFTPTEIEHLLTLGINQAPSQRVVEQETEVLLGQPDKPPALMVDALNQLLVKHSDVGKAYIALMHDKSIDDKPHLVVGIEALGDITEILQELGAVAADTAPSGEAVDLYQVDENDAGLSQYFLKECQPFYQRAVNR